MMISQEALSATNDNRYHNNNRNKRTVNKNGVDVNAVHVTKRPYHCSEDIIKRMSRDRDDDKYLSDDNMDYSSEELESYDNNVRRIRYVKEIVSCTVHTLATEFGLDFAVVIPKNRLPDASGEARS